jgi:inorganic pyrophosphatase
MTDNFWNCIDQLVRDSRIVIDRPKGSTHPRYPDMIYPVDYGYLDNTTAMDGGGIDIWVGTTGSGRVEAIICTVDLLKRDSEIKLLIACSDSEQAIILQTHNEGNMGGVLIPRPG